MNWRIALATVLGAAVLMIGLSPGQTNAGSASVPESAQTLAFPGAMGWAAQTPGGRGGKVIRVTTLAAEGPGSLLEALNTRGPRIVVFEVGGVIDLNAKTVKIKEPFLTIAGQTAPSPGITLIRGGIDITTHDIIIRHIRIRPGTAGAPLRSGTDFDSISTVSGSRIIVDHCSLTWGTDENLSASGKRFVGDTLEDWRRNVSNAITFSNNIIAEGLANATHAKGEHSKGSLIHDNVTKILIVGNLYAHNYERNPLFKGGVHGVLVNNFIYNPGQRAIHYNLMANEWGDHPYQTGKLVAVGNVLRAGVNTPDKMAFFMLGGAGDVEYFGKDNIAVDRIGRPLPEFGRYATGAARIMKRDSAMLWPEGLQAMPAEQVETSVLTNAGARPWDRDLNDVRLLADVAEGRGKIIDSEAELGGYPVMEVTKRVFDPAKWDMDTMLPLDPALYDDGAKAKGT